MNSLHTALPQKTPVRGVRLHPLEETRGDHAQLAQSISVAAIEQRRQTLFARSMDALRKATRGNGMMPHVVAFLVALFAVANIATAQNTYFWVGGGSTDWGRSTNWSLTSGGPGGAGVPGFPYGNAQDAAIFDGNSGTNITILTGFPTNGAAASIGQIRLLNSVSTGPQLVFGGAGSTMATIRLGGTMTSTNNPLFVGSLCRLFIDQNITMEMLTNLGGAGGSASIFGDLSIRPGGTVTNTVGSRFRIEDGGSLRMSGGTFTTAGAASAVLYALTGTRGSLVYDRNDNTTVTIPAPNDATEVPITVLGPPGTMLGNLVIRRPAGSITTFINAQTYDLGGTLIVDACPLNFPNDLIMNLAASRMLNNGNIFAASTTLGNNLFYRDLAAGAGQTPLNPTVSDLSFGTNLAGPIPNGQYLNRLANSIPGMNLSINSDLNIVALNAAAAGILLGNAAAGGQLTIPVMRTVTLRQGTGTIDAGMNTGRLIVNGIFAIATGATIANNNTNTNSPLAGVLVNAGGRLQLNGTASITGTADGAFYNGPTATLEYLDRDATTLSPFPGVVAVGPPFNNAPTTKAATTAEIPRDMRGGIIVNRLTPSTALGILTTVAMPANTVMSGPLTLTQGTFGLNNFQLILNGTVTTNVGGGYIAGGDVANASALVYNSTANGTIAVTTANVAPHGRIFNYIEINNSGNLSFASGQKLTIDGSNPPVFAMGPPAVNLYGLAGVSNYNGQLRFNGTGNLVLNASEITFTGTGAANTTPAAQGGHIPITTASVGAIFGDNGARLIFSRVLPAGVAQIRSFPRFAPGGQVLNEIFLQSDGMANPSPAGVAPATLTDYMVSLRTPLQTSIVTLKDNAILQLANSANLTVLNPPDLATAANVPNNAGNFIDASQGGSLQLRGYLAAGNVTIPVGVSFVDVNGGVLPSRYRPITVSNSITALPGENYTVTVTSNIVNLVPAIPSLVNNSMRGQWNITSGSGVNGAGGVLNVGWGNTVFPLPVGTVAGDQPAQFAATLNAAGPPAGSTLTTIRRWTGTTYSNVLPTNPVANVNTNGQSIQATYNGALSNTVFIVSNELFPIFWVGGSPAAGDWGVTNNWASVSGGTPGSANPPGVNDWAVFDRAQAPRITTNIPANIQQMSVIEGANVTLAPTDLPRNLSLNRDLADNDNLLIGPNSRLSLGSVGGGGFPMTLTVPVTGTANGPNTSVFGTLAILGNATYNHADGNSTILIANGGTLLIGSPSASSVPAVLTGFQKNATTTLQYGGNTNSVPPYTPLSADENKRNATLRYEDGNGGIEVRAPGVATGELPATPFPGNLVINKTVPGAGLRFNADYQVTSSATLQAGILDLTMNAFTVGFSATAPGTFANPIDNPPGSRTLNILGALPNTGIRGAQVAASILNLNGAGTHTLQFVPGGELLGSLVLNDQSNLAPNAALTANLITNLRVTTFTMTNARTAVSTTGSGMIVNPNLTFRIDGNTSVITSGRMLVNGTLALPTGGAVALPAALATGGIDIGTTGTLNIINDGNVTGTPAANPVRYLNASSRLLYSAEGAGFANKTVDPMSFPQIFNGTLVIDKNFSAATTTNTVDLATVGAINGCRVVTQGTVQLVGGDLRLLGFMFKIGSAAQTIPAAADVLNNTISTTARLLPGGGRIFGDNAAGASSFVYNSTQNANLWLGELNVASVHIGRFLNKLEINGPASLTLSTSAVVNIESGALPVCDNTYQGTLRLDNSTGNLALNGSSLRFTGTVAPTAGQILTNGTSGTISGDALPGTSIAITSERRFNVRMASGAGAALRSFSLNPAAVAPVAGDWQISLLSSMTTDEIGVTRNIVSLALPTVNLNVTGIGSNSTSGNLMAGASFGLTNNNFIHTSEGTLTLTVPNNATRMFPIGAFNNLNTTMRPAPLTITNQGGASATYTVGVRRSLTFQDAVYPDKVNLQWTILRSPSAANNQTVQYGWHTEHESGVGFQRQNGFLAQWGGTAYNQLASTLSSSVAASAPVGMEWSQTFAFPSVNMTGIANPFAVLAPPAAIILAADFLTPSGSGGFNTLAAPGFLSPGAGNLTITSGTPFTLRVSSFNGLNQRSPVRIFTNVRANLQPLTGGIAVFTTTGTGSAITPMTMDPTVPVPPGAGTMTSTTTTNITFDWVNPGNATSTQATLVLYDPSGFANSLTSASLTITILAPPLRASTIAYTQVQNSSTGTQGFNGGGLGQFNITSGVGFPIDFGFFSHSNFLVATTANTSMQLSIVALSPAGAMVDISPNIPTAMPPVTINPITVNSGQTGGSWRVGTLPAIVNWTNGGAMGGGVVKARLTLTANVSAGSPQMFSTSVVISLGTGATVPVKLGYAVNSGDIADPALSTLGVNNGNFTPASTQQILSGIPFPVNFASFADNGMVVRPPTTTQVQMSLAPVTPGANFALTNNGPITIASTNGIASMLPRITWTNPGNSAGYADVRIILSVVSGTSLISTDVTISVFTTGTVPVVIAMSQTSTNGTQGVNNNTLPLGAGGTAQPIPISSGVPFNIDYGFYNAWGLPASSYPANGSFTLDPVPPFAALLPGESITIDGTPTNGTNSLFLPFAVSVGRIPGVILNWRGRTAASPTTVDYTLRLSANFSGILMPTTTVTIRLSSSASVPAFLGLSQVSSTSSVGVNGGVAIVSGQPFNVDAGLFDTNGSLTSSQTNVSANLSVSTPPGSSGSFTIAGNISGVFVNQPGIRYNNVIINWTNPPSANATTTVRLTISTTAGIGPIRSTFADIVISAADVFPRISTITPAAGGAGTVVQITGVNFTGVNSVTFNGAAAASFQVLGDGVITATAPAGVSTGPITVSRPASGAIPSGSGVSPVPFTVGATPVITGLSPTAGGTGTRVLIIGTNLGGATSVRIAGLDAQIIENTTTGVIAVITGMGTGTQVGPVTIATLGGVIVSSQLFTYNLAPIITSVTPNSAVVNGQPIPIIIRGQNFNFPLMPIAVFPSTPTNQLELLSGVYFSEVNSPMGISPAAKISVQSVSPTEIRATIAGSLNNMAGQRFIFVQNADGQSANIAFQLTPAQAPVITSITPNTTTASGVAFTAVLTGANFFGQAGTTITAITPTGSTPVQFSAVSPTQLNVVIPGTLNSVGQTIQLRVQNSDGQFATTQLIIRDPGRPFIDRVTPPRAVVGSSSITITIIGGNYFLNAIVTLNNTELQVLSRSTNSIIAVVPASSLTAFGSPTLSVRNGVGGFAAFAFFPIGYPAPTITAVVTASGPNPGQPVTSASVFPFQIAVNGTGFREGVSVTFNGTNLSIISTSPTQVIAAVPGELNRIQGVFPVVLRNADGQSAEGLFTISTANGPVITSLSPTTEVANGQPFILTINGRNFSVNQQGQILAGTQVLFNGQSVAILQSSTTRLVVQIPAGVNNREGTALVEVVNSDLQRTSFQMPILCGQCPIVRSFTPSTVRPTNNLGFDITFTLNGSNFRPGAVVTVGGSPLRVVSVSDSVIVAAAPPGTFFGNGEIIVTNLDGRRFTVPPGQLLVNVRDVVSTPMTGRMYPNPVDDMMTFETDVIKPSLLRVRISDVLGRTVTSFEQQVNTGRFTHQLDVSGLPTGVYIFEMTDGSRRYTEKMMKR